MKNIIATHIELSGYSSQVKVESQIRKIFQTVWFLQGYYKIYNNDP